MEIIYKYDEMDDVVVDVASDFYITEKHLPDNLNFCEVIIPEGVVRIDAGLFKDNKSLKKVVFPSSLFRIEQEAFMNCIALNTIEFGEKNNYLLEHDAFMGCTKLTDKDGFVIANGRVLGYAGQNREITIPKSITSIQAGAFSRNEIITKVTVPDNVKIIERETFYHCDNLEEVILPSTIQRIEDEAFVLCSKLKIINLPENLKVIGEEAFWACNSLEKVELPYGLQSIGNEALRCDIEQKELVIPDSVTKIGECIFGRDGYGWKKLERLTISKNIKKIRPIQIGTRNSLKEIVFRNPNIEIKSPHLLRGIKLIFEEACEGEEFDRKINEEECNQIKGKLNQDINLKKANLYFFDKKNCNIEKSKAIIAGCVISKKINSKTSGIVITSNEIDKLNLWKSEFDELMQRCNEGKLFFITPSKLEVLLDPIVKEQFKLPEKKKLVTAINLQKEAQGWIAALELDKTYNEFIVSYGKIEIPGEKCAASLDIFDSYIDSYEYDDSEKDFIKRFAREIITNPDCESVVDCREYVYGLSLMAFSIFCKMFVSMDTKCNLTFCRDKYELRGDYSDSRRLTWEISDDFPYGVVRREKWDQFHDDITICNECNGHSFEAPLTGKYKKSIIEAHHRKVKQWWQKDIVLPD